MKLQNQLHRQGLRRRQWSRLVALAEGELKGVLLMAMTTGQPLSRILDLTLADVDQAKCTVSFAQPKSGRRRVLPLDVRVRLWLEQQPQSPVPWILIRLCFPNWRLAVP